MKVLIVHTSRNPRIHKIWLIGTRACGLIRENYLLGNKQEFQRHHEVNNVKQKIEKEFYDFLANKGFIRDSQQQTEKADIFTNEFARRLDKLLQQKEFKFLNPFNDLRIRTVVLQTDGNVAVSQEENGQEVIFKTRRIDNKPTGGGRIWDTIGDESEDIGFVRDDKGKQLGKDVETKSNGLSISKLSFPNDPREGWVDNGLGAVVYNLAHSFAKNPEVQSGIAGYYNMARVVISTLIKEGNEKQLWTQKKDSKSLKNCIMICCSQLQQPNEWVGGE